MENGSQRRTFFTDIKLFPIVDDKHDTGSGRDEDLQELRQALDASSQLVSFFDAFGSLMSFSKNDFEGNIKKIRNKSQKAAELKTFEELLRYELDKNESKQSESACIATLWYKRGLSFIAALIEQIVLIREENLNKAFQIAYESTLKPHHGWMIQKAITMMAKTIPYRSQLIKALSFGSEGSEKQFEEDAMNYLANLKQFQSYLHGVLVKLGLETA